MKNKLIMIFVACIFSTSLFAARDFKCVVLDSVTVSDGGELEVSKISKMYLKREFVVDRETGKMIGDISNHNSGFKPVVHDYLPNENGYKAITTYSPHPSIQYLHIKEYVETIEKPFFYITSSSILSGTCTYF